MAASSGAPRLAAYFFKADPDVAKWEKRYFVLEGCELSCACARGRGHAAGAGGALRSAPSQL